MDILHLKHHYQLTSLLCCVVLMSQAVDKQKKKWSN